MTGGIDTDRLQATLLRLLGVPSPSGRTDEVVQVIGDHLLDLGLEPELTRRGAISVRPSGSPPGSARAMVAHADTIGAMVREIKPNGRLRLTPIGTHSARFAEGARVTVFVDDPSITYSGTVLPIKASGHRWGDEVDTQGVGWDHVELRLDEHIESAADICFDTMRSIACPMIVSTCGKTGTMR